MASTRERTLLIVRSPAEGAAADWQSAMARFADSTHVLEAADLPSARAQLAAGGVELVVLCQSRPGEFSAAEIEALRRCAPLARFWRHLGSWCEGEQRTAPPPPGCTNTYWHQWPPRAARQLSAAQQGICPAWGLPLTATAEEQTLADAELPIEPRAGRIAIFAGRAETAVALADVCRLAGYEPVIIHRTCASLDGERFNAATASVALWDTSIERACDGVLVEQVEDMAGGAPVVAMVGFPRPGDESRATQAGIAALVSKPFQIRDLLWQVARVAESGATAV
jgi:hypothetical protein